MNVVEPNEWYQWMRERHPLYYNDFGKRPMWNVFTYPNVQAVLATHSHFSSLPTTSESAWPESLIGSDPPQHDHLRKLVSLAFTPNMIAQLEKRIGEVANELLDRVVPGGGWMWLRTLPPPSPRGFFWICLGPHWQISTASGNGQELSSMSMCSTWMSPLIRNSWR